MSSTPLDRRVLIKRLRGQYITLDEARREGFELIADQVIILELDDGQRVVPLFQFSGHKDLHPVVAGVNIYLTVILKMSADQVAWWWLEKVKALSTSSKQRIGLLGTDREKDLVAMTDRLLKPFCE